MKRILIPFLKVAISLGIIGYLVWKATRGNGEENAFVNFSNQPKEWGYLLAALVVSFAAVVLTFVRWWFLVRALEIPCRFRDAFRISFWGYLFNLSPIGVVGGDLVKVVMLGHENPEFRAKSAASVVVDRVIGLYLLFVVASVGIYYTGFWSSKNNQIHVICQLTIWITLVGGLGVAMMLIPGVTDGKLTRWLGKLPKVGHTIESLIDAVRMYRRKPMVLFLSSLMSIGVHCLFAVAIYLIAHGLPGNVLSLGDHFVIMPVSTSMGVIPFPMGPFEFMLDFFYAQVSLMQGIEIAKGQGLVIAFCYRLITLMIAALGIPYYLGNRKEVTEAIHEGNDEV